MRGTALDAMHVIRVSYLPFAETLILICFGLDSSRLAICRVKTPLRYSARMFSELTVFGREKLRMNAPYVRSIRRQFSSLTSFSHFRSPRMVKVLFVIRTS